MLLYRGPTSHSEVEIRNLIQYMSHLQRMDGYVSFHSFRHRPFVYSSQNFANNCYSDLWLVPFGYDNDAYPADFDDLVGGPLQRRGLSGE